MEKRAQYVCYIFFMSFSLHTRYIYIHRHCSILRPCCLELVCKLQNEDDEEEEKKMVERRFNKDENITYILRENWRNVEWREKSLRQRKSYTHRERMKFSLRIILIWLCLCLCVTWHKICADWSRPKQWNNAAVFDGNTKRKSWKKKLDKAIRKFKRIENS